MLTEANYQQAAVCEVCGETVGEPLQADSVVNYNGVDYAEFDLDAETLQHGWEDPGILTYKIRCYFRVPVGYDGIVVYSTSDNGDKEGYVNEIADENTVFFRLK